MPLTGTRDLSEIADTAPLLASLETEEWELKGAQHLQLHYELGGDREALLPPALHPSIPPTLLVNVTQVPDSEVGAFTFATVRVGCRAGARPRGLLVRGYCDSAAAVSVLRERWGLPLEVADVQLDPSYARATTSVTVDGTCVLAGELVDPQPITGADVQYMATLALARVARDGEETLLLQVDPDYTFDRAQRGRARLTAFEAEAWNLPGASASHPISASLTTVDMTLPRLRYLIHPDKDPLSAVELLPQPQPA
ncbi:MAG: acetoacetate decarboxylase family protein [Chloroflexi bacterium]|nr:acetoacetate decarboxylase family protein [Chloroflexota bacterium]